MDHSHSPRFLQIAEAAKQQVNEIEIGELKRKMEANEKFLLLDVREDHEWAVDHLPAAIHLGRGIIERDIEARVPDVDTPLVLYCGGGFRSALAAQNLQKMGYTHVLSLAGGIRAWRDRNLPLEVEGNTEANSRHSS